MSETVTTPAMPVDGRAAAPGQLTGSAIAGLFGLIYLEVNAGPLPGPWAATLRIAAAVAAAVLVFVLLLGGRATAGSTAPANAGPGSSATFGRRYWLIVAGEAVGIWAGATILSAFGQPGAVVAWVSVVVGTHFFALSALWRLRMLRYLGAAITLSGLAGLAAAFAAASGAVVATAGGVLPGLLLLAAAYRGAIGAAAGRPVRLPRALAGSASRER